MKVRGFKLKMKDPFAAGFLHPLWLQVFHFKWTSCVGHLASAREKSCESQARRGGQRVDGAMMKDARLQ